jgi:tetratricopeptide (TPR) repeat protein
MTSLRSMLAATLLAASALATAQVAAPPADSVFTDPDPTAKVFFPRVETPSGRARLDAHIAANPADSRGWGARAVAHAFAGESDAALADLERARGVNDSNPLRQRNTLWSEGWARLHLGHVPEAHAAWSESVRLHGGRPFWVPYSFALLAELGGEPHVALAWYETAVRSAPQKWSQRGSLERATRHWQHAEREAILAVFERWNARTAESGARP